MTDLDLSGAYQAAHEELPVNVTAGDVVAAIRAVAPLIERQVRERIAADIAALPDYGDDARTHTLDQVERLVRGGVS